MIKSFAIFKAKQSDNEKAPSHNISAKIGEEYVNIGACWKKEGKSGAFLSCKLQDVWVDHSDRTKCRKGYAIADEKKIMLDKPIEEPEDTSQMPNFDLDNDF